MRKHERIPGTCTPTCDSNVYELGPRVRLHVTEIKSHSGMKKFLFTRDFHPSLTTIKCGLNQKQPSEVFYKKWCY